MVSGFALAMAVRELHAGGIIAYPTEGVFGIGCLPSRPDAVERVLELKARDRAKGLILIASHESQVEGWADIDSGLALAGTDARPVTWIVPAGRLSYPALTGGRTTIAIRITTHPVAGRLARLAGEPLVSTSANLSGRAPVRNRFVLRRHFGEKLDAIVPGSIGPAHGPSEIRDLATGRVLRPS